MAIDAVFKCPYSKSEARAKLSKYIYAEEEEYGGLILNCSGKFAWAYYETDYETGVHDSLLSIKFSHDFSQEELVLFIEELSSLGFIPDQLPV